MGRYLSRVTGGAKKKWFEGPHSSLWIPLYSAGNKTESEVPGEQMKKSTVHVCWCQCWEHLSLTWQDWEGTLKSNYVTEAWLCFSGGGGGLCCRASGSKSATLTVDCGEVEFGLSPPPPLPCLCSSHSAFTRGCYNRKSLPRCGCLELGLCPLNNCKKYIFVLYKLQSLGDSVTVAQKWTKNSGDFPKLTTETPERGSVDCQSALVNGP